MLWHSQNGLLSSLPYFGKYAMAVLASALADHLLRKKALTTVQARKIFTTFATMTPGFLMIAQIFFGLDRTWSVTIFTLQLFLNGAVTAGYLGNGLDIAPNFSGTIFGLANTVSSIGGYLSTYIVGTLTAKNVSAKCWLDPRCMAHFLISQYVLLCSKLMASGRLYLESWPVRTSSVHWLSYSLAKVKFSHGIIHPNVMWSMTKTPRRAFHWRKATVW